MDYMDELQTLRAEYRLLKRAQASIQYNPLGHDEFDEELLRVEFATPRKTLAAMFPRIGAIEDRMALQDFSIKIRQMEKLLTLVSLEIALVDVLPPKLAAIADEGLSHDAHALVSTFKQAAQVWENKEIAVSPYQIEGDANLDPVLLEQRYSWVHKSMAESDEEGLLLEIHEGIGEIQLLDELHNTRLEYASLHVERAQMLLDHARNILLQRARAANATYEGVLQANDALIKHPDNLMDYSDEWSAKAGQILFRLEQFYRGMEQSGTQSGPMFHVYKYVPLTVSFDFMS